MNTSLPVLPVWAVNCARFLRVGDSRLFRLADLVDGEFAQFVPEDAPDAPAMILDWAGMQPLEDGSHRVVAHIESDNSVTLQGWVIGYAVEPSCEVVVLLDRAIAFPSPSLARLVG
jgi:hypothetical protein